MTRKTVERVLEKVYSELKTIDSVLDEAIWTYFGINTETLLDESIQLFDRNEGGMIEVLGIRGGRIIFIDNRPWR